MDPAILQSLQEIASLLLLVHDDYLRDVFGYEVLTSLTLLLKDVGLDSSVSILDSERLRRSVMGTSDSDMGYELFYDWLRGVGQLVYKDQDFTGKKAVHYLLTRYIIPFASSKDENGEGSKHSGEVYVPYYSDSALKVMVDYGDFLQNWYYEVVAQVRWLNLLPYVSLIINHLHITLVLNSNQHCCFMGTIVCGNKLQAMGTKVLLLWPFSVP